MKKYTFDIVLIDEMTDEYAVQLTDEFCKELDWRTDDVIEWIDLKDGTYQIVNKTKEARENISK